MKNSAKIEGTTEAWEERQLGCDEEFAKPADIDLEQLDDALDLQMISIRLQKGLLDGLKVIAQLNGIGYQPLIKQVLHRFVAAEMRMIAMNALENSEKLEENEGCSEVGPAKKSDLDVRKRA